jgi:hypothetical protein
MFGRYGAPRQLLSDLGKSIMQQFNTTLSKQLGTTQVVESQHDSTTQRILKLTKQRLQNRLQKLMNMEQDDWDDHLEAIAYYLRTQRWGETIFTPFFLMYGRKPNPLVYNQVELDHDYCFTDATEEELEKFTEDRMMMMQNVYKKVHL